jgi:hypothetical protein
VSALGTYDEEWEASRCPAPPDDFSFGFFNSAPSSLQLAGYLRGGEEIRLRNMAVVGDVVAAVPCWLVAVDVTHGKDPREPIQESPDAKIDTCHILPDEGHLVLVWRAVLPLGEAYDKDVISVCVRADALAATAGNPRAGAAPASESSVR